MDDARPHQIIGTLMVIDDNKIDQMVYRRIVERSGCVGTLLSFCEADVALDYLTDASNPQPDLILLDINMPRMDGFGFLTAATETFGESFAPVVVMLTTSLEPADEVRARGFGIVRDFRNKPLTAQMLQEFCEMLADAGRLR